MVESVHFLSYYGEDSGLYIHMLIKYSSDTGFINPTVLSAAGIIFIKEISVNLDISIVASPGYPFHYLVRTYSDSSRAWRECLPLDPGRDVVF